MSEHRFRLEHRVSHADVDLLGEMKLQALLGLLQLAAVEASTDAGLDPRWYTDANRFWLIRRTHLERLLPVGGGDLVEVETSVADWRRARSLRRYEVRLAEPGRGIRDWSEPTAGALVARATTDWVYCDRTSGRPVSIPEDVRRAFSGDAHAESLPRDRPLADRGGGDPAEIRLVVRASHLDHVAHVNNAAYASYLEDGAFELFARDGFGVDAMLARGGALRPSRLDVEYLVDAVAGDELVVRTWDAGEAAAGAAAAPSEPTEPVASGGPAAGAPTGAEATPRRLGHAIVRADGTLLVRAETAWTWRRRARILGGPPLD